MKNYICRILFLVFAVLSLPSISVANEPIKVGVFQNKPIVYHEKKAMGLFVEVLDHVAEKENWNIEYTECQLKDCLSLLQKGEIQLMTSLGVSEERLKYFQFSKVPIWTFWGTVYANNPQINSVLDLDGKKIAVRRGNKTTRMLKEILHEFQILPEYVEFDNYEPAFKALDSGDVEVVAANNTYAFSSREEQISYHKTPIVFNPFSAYFAIKKDSRYSYLLEKIDKHASRLKSDSHSLYHTFIKEWLGVASRSYWSFKRVALMFGPILLFVIFIMIAWHYRSVVLINSRLTKSIADHEQAEIQIIEQKEILQKALEVGRIGSWEFDINSREFSWSDENNKIFGLQPGTTITFETFLDCVHHDDKEYVENKWQEALLTSNYDIEHRITVNNVVKWVREKAEFEVNDKEGFIKGVGFTQDITEEKQAEEEKRELEKKLNQSQKLEAIGRLAGGIAHDLNNLLTPIVGYSDLLLSDPDASEQNKNRIKQIIKASNGASGLVRQLLAFSRRQAFEYKPVKINDILTDFEKLLRRTLPESIDIQIIESPEPLFVLADVGQVEQVTMNLSINAADAMPRGGKLTIETSYAELDENYVINKPDLNAGDYIMIAFSDTGQGMDEETSSQMFEPFFSTKGEMGTGLGLATVYGIVKQHKGHILVYSEIDHGTTLKVYLPLSTVHNIERSNSTQKTIDVQGNETILVAEDNNLVIDIVEEIVSSYGYNVLVAENGDRVFEILNLSTSNIDLLLTDVVMPDMSGKELYEKVSKQNPGTKVLYMSGYTDNVIMNHGVLEEEIQFIQKPFTAHAIASKIREVLDT